MKPTIWRAAFAVMLLAAVDLRAAMPEYTSARALGMGSAFSTLATENAGLFYNPAGIGGLRSREISGLYTTDPFGVGYSLVSYGQPLTGFGGIAAGWRAAGTDFEATDAFGAVLGEQRAADEEYAAGIGYLGDSPLSAGLSVRSLRRQVGGFSLTGIQYAAGLLYEAESFRWSLVVHNLLSQNLTGTSLVTGSPVEESTPQKVTLGVSLFKDRFPGAGLNGERTDTVPQQDSVQLEYSLCADLNAPLSGKGPRTVNAGLEVWIDRLLGVRAGAFEMRDFTAGASILTGLFRLDYAFILSSTIRNTHVFSASFYF